MRKESSSVSMDKIAGCEGSFFGAGDGSDFVDSDRVEWTAFWELMVNSYFPLAPTWMKRSFFAIIMLARTLIVGHFITLLFGNISEWKKEGTPSWMVNALQSLQSRSEARAWPPTTLAVLALLTVVTLVIHPDGLTWILLRKVKSPLISVMEPLFECWQVFITDYGILSSIIAAAAIAGFVFLVFVALRNSISSRKAQKTSASPEKKRKKRKVNARHRSGKPKPTPASPSRSRSGSIDISADLSASNLLATPGENTPDLVPLTPVSSNRQLIAPDDPVSYDDTCRLDDFPEKTVGTWPVSTTINSKSVMTEKLLSARTRVASVSTLDTTAMSDDLSCSSKSIVSVPSVGTGSTKSTRGSNVVSQPSTPSNEVKNSKSGPGVAYRQNKRGANSTQMGMATPTPSECPSRWDALKPGHSQRNQPNQHDRPTQTKNVDRQVRQRHVGPHRPQNRRVGRNTGGGLKGTTAVPQVPTSTVPAVSPKNRFVAQTPIAAPVVDGTRECFVRPPPPPGLGPMATGLINERTSGTAYYSQQPMPSAGVVHSMSGPALPTYSWNSVMPILGTEAQLPDLPAQPVDQYSYRFADRGSSLPVSRTRFSSFSHIAEPSPQGYGLSTGVVKENPFAPDLRHSEEQIEAELQALGGQMAGSILDF